MTAPVIADDVLLRSHREASEVPMPADREQLAFVLVAFRHKEPLERVKDVVIADQFHMGAG